MTGPLDDEDLETLDRLIAHDSDIRASSVAPLLAEVRLLRAKVASVEITRLGEERRRLLCCACGEVRDGGPLVDPTPTP